MTDATDDGIEIDRDVAAPPAAVFAAWTEPQHVARWFGGPAVDVPAEHLDWRPEPGRTWTARMTLPGGDVIDWAGEFTEVLPVERFGFTLTDRPQEPQRAGVLVELTPTADGTRIRFAQETPGFAAEQQQALIAGWRSFLDELARIAES